MLKGPKSAGLYRVKVGGRLPKAWVRGIEITHPRMLCHVKVSLQKLGCRKEREPFGRMWQKFTNAEMGSNEEKTVVICTSNFSRSY